MDDSLGNADQFDHVKTYPFNSYHNELNDIWPQVMEYAAINSYIERRMGWLSLVCRKWQSFIKSHRFPILVSAICREFSIDYETCTQYLNSKLTFRLDPFSDQGEVAFSIMDVIDPLGGAFNLSHYKINGESLDRYIGSISVGYQTVLQTGYIEVNKDSKLRIWVTPRFQVKKEIREGRAQFLGRLFSKLWPKSIKIGLFWISGNMYGSNLDWYVYLLNHPLDRGNHDWNTIWDNAQSTKDGFLTNPLHAILCKCLSLSMDRPDLKRLKYHPNKAR